MPQKYFPTGNSGTKIAFDDAWRVLDIGSGHNPHPRADVLADKFLLDDTERSGAAVVLPVGKSFVIADACAMPFKENAFDFLVCSHVIEHIEDIDAFCGELNRVARGGYVECPSKLSEVLRHPPNHRWFVINQNGKLIIEPTPNGYPLGWFGKLFFSLYFYGTRQVTGRDVFAFAHGVPQPFHFFLKLTRAALTNLWLAFKPFTYMRLLWQGEFSWTIHYKQESK
ncbi:MAG: hypothetical protein Fur002_23290 [Anaerolineales bacterium]